jgi:hypothetical protein
MYIKCEITSVDLNGKPYVNRPINMDYVTTFDASTTVSNDKSFPSIKFTTGNDKNAKYNILQWVFTNDVDRDSILERLHKILNTVTIEKGD